MVAVYPAALVTTTDIPDAGANLSTNPHSSLHNKNRDEIVAIEAELGVAPSSSSSTVAARFNTMWEKIASASFSAASTVDITIPASTYLVVRITIWGFLATGTQQLLARVNNDSTAGLHRYMNSNASADTVATAVNTSATSWRVGDMNAVQAAVTTLTLCQCHQASRVPFLAVGGMYDTTEAAASQITASGSTSIDRTISSLRIFPAASTMTGFYFAEGVRL